MSNILKTCLFFFIIFSAAISKAGFVSLVGTYQGKNIYVQNPFSGNKKDYCTIEVYVNDVKVNTNISSSAYEIDLSHLKVGQPVAIKIVHRDDCKPQILNKDAVGTGQGFVFTSFQVDKNHLTWATKGESAGGKMYIEHFEYLNWVTVKTLSGQGSKLLNNYSSKASVHFSGANKYRIKYVAPDGKVTYSQVVEYVSDLPKVTLYPTRVTDKVTLSREAEYEVQDANNKVVLKGRGTIVDFTGKASGVYYINVDNITTKVFKK